MGACNCAALDDSDLQQADAAMQQANLQRLTEHTEDLRELCARLRTNHTLGLTREQAGFRLKHEGQNVAPNKIGEPSSGSVLSHTPAGFYPGWEDQKISVIRNGQELKVTPRQLPLI